MKPPRLQLIGIHKSYGQTLALRGVDLTLEPGEIHAIIGENGAGKSTLMKIVCGLEQADQGQMMLDGQSYRPRDPRSARRFGLVMVHQELTLAPDLSVEANLVLGQEDSWCGFLSRSRNRARTMAALQLLDHAEIQPEAAIADLSTAECQLVEIARALLTEVRVLILDEPTSALTAQDAQRLMALLRTLRNQGVAIVYISHFLEELEALADRFTVLRDGRSVGTGFMKEATRQQWIEMMVGRTVTDQYPCIPHQIGSPILELTDACGAQAPVAASVTLHRGEVLGIAGIVGAGRTELLRTIFGLDPLKSGSIRVQGVAGVGSPRLRIAQGCGLLSEDRTREGLALERDITDNLTYSWLHPYAWLGLLSNRRRRAAVREWLQRLHVRYQSENQAVASLSGGNQQKIALGRLLHQQADIFLLDEPTRGVDVAAKAEIYRLIGTLAAEGKAILIVSSYLPELFGVCDSLAVMFRGRLSPVRPLSQWTPQQVVACATGNNQAE